MSLVKPSAAVALETRAQPLAATRSELAHNLNILAGNQRCAITASRAGTPDLSSRRCPGLGLPSPGGSIGTGPDGAIYYCDRVQYTDGYEWALSPGLIPNPQPPPDISPGSPCMVP